MAMPRSFQNEGGGTAIGNLANGITSGGVRVEKDGESFLLGDGAVVIAAITSCTNTSNPAVMLGAGLLAKKAAAKGLKAKPWVKTSIGPGSLVVTDYLKKTGLLKELEKIGFYIVGYGCTTCIGNSGPLPAEISKGIAEGDLAVASVLSGNRNFEGRVHPEVKMNYLASPPLVVAYALAGYAGYRSDQGSARHRQRWQAGVPEGHLAKQQGNLRRHRRRDQSGDVREELCRRVQGRQPLEPDRLARWRPVYKWERFHLHQEPALLRRHEQWRPGSIEDIHGARVLGLFGDSITTDHISPAGSIKKDSPAGRFLISKGVEPKDFNSYGSRRGNDDVMVRGTFANIRIKNLMLDGVEGGYTLLRAQVASRWPSTTQR